MKVRKLNSQMRVRLAGGAWAAALLLFGAQPRAAELPPGSGLKIFVREDRMYQVTGADIAARGFDLTAIDAAGINLFHKAMAEPILIEGAGEDGKLRPETTITFWGEFPRGQGIRRNPVTLENPYYLRFGGIEPPKRYTMKPARKPTAGMLPVEARLKAARLEADLELAHYQQYKGEPTDRVMWMALKSPPQTDPRNHVEFRLDDLAPGKKPEAMRVMFWGSNDLAKTPDHRWKLTLNGQELGTAEWDGNTSIVFETDKLGEFYRKGEMNRLGFENVQAEASIDAALLDWIEIDYEARLMPEQEAMEFTLPGEPKGMAVKIGPGFVSGPIRVFDRTMDLDWGGARVIEMAPGKKKFGSTERVEYGDRYLGAERTLRAAGAGGYLKPERMIVDRPSALGEMAEAPNYLAISHADFLTALEPLLALRREQGMTALAVDVEDIYDEYSDGIFDPEAIRRFMDDVIEKSESGAGALKYVFLVGDATYDYHNIRKGTPNFVPTHHAPEQEDAFLPEYSPTIGLDEAFVYGRGAHEGPRVAIGRLPAKTAEVTAGYVRKVLEYEAAARTEEFKTREKRAVLIASFGFESTFEAMKRQKYWDGWVTDVIAGDGKPENDPKMPGRVVEAVSSGCELAYFVGHGAFYMWRTGPSVTVGSSYVFTEENIAQLANRGRYPILFASTCFSALFDAPLHAKSHSDSGVGIYWVEAPDRGAVALVAQVGKVTAWDADRTNKAIIDFIFEGPGDRLGDAWLAGKKKLHGASFLSGVSIIGDPAVWTGHLRKAPGAGTTAQAASGE